MNRAELAAIYGVAKTTVDQWVSDGCPILKRPSRAGDPAEFDTAAVSDWLVERAVRRVRGSGRRRANEDEDTRGKRIKADLLELRLERERGALLPADEVARVDEALMGMIHDGMLAIPAAAAEVLCDAAQRGGAAEVATVLAGYIERALTDAAEAEFEVVEDGYGADHSGAGVGPDGRGEAPRAGEAEAAAEADDL